MNGREKYAELHLHSMDQYDSDNKPEAVCKRLSELGAAGFALTQHGVLSGIEPMREAAKKYKLKFIPGIEAYYGNQGDIRKNKHLIIWAANYEGYKALWKAVSLPSVQDSAGRAVFSLDTLKEHFGPGSPGHGNVIASSACINGVIAGCLRANDEVQREIEKVQNKITKYESSGEKVILLQSKLAEIATLVDDAAAQKNQLKAQAEARFAKREKMVAKLKERNDPSFNKELEKLEEDKQASLAAKKMLEEQKKKLASLKTRQSRYAKELKELQDKADREAAYLTQISALEDQLMTDDELYFAAREETIKMSEIFGKENFYMEIQNHGIDKEAEIYPVLVDIAKELEIPLVATNDVHMVTNSREELLKRQILKALRFGEWEELYTGDDQLYIKTDPEMRAWLLRLFDESTVSEAMGNIQVIFDRCDVAFPEETHYPVFPVSDGKTTLQVFIDAVQRGIRWRFPEGMNEVYKDRLNKEYKVIRSMGFIDYHLIVKDFLEYGRVLAAVPPEEIANAPLSIKDAEEWVKKHGWQGGFSIGPGRGSAAGSLICYCLGITNIDPLKHDLLFERFLNAERVSMPDIDSDVSNRVRQKVIEYVKTKYGEDAVCGIMTTNAQAPRGAVRISAKYYGLSLNKDKEFLSLGDRIAKLIPNEPGISFQSSIGSGTPAKTVYEMLIGTFAQDEHALKIIDWARVIEGCFTAYGAHAAGIVISDGAPVSEYIPLRWNAKMHEMTTQVDMSKVEEKGLIKMDILGLKTLDIITDCIRLIQHNYGITINPLEIPLDDVNIYHEIFAKARTNSVFQFESDGMKNMLRRFQPNSFEDLIILVSMFRPGPLQYIDNVINVKTGKEPATYLCKELKPILGKTYAGIVYQEQVMEIFQRLAGYTLGGADEVRRFMSKKKMDKLAHERESFIYGDPERNIDGCIKRGIDEETAGQLFDQMTEFAKYAFNKSHAAAYATNSYYTAWLKYYYPAEFLAAALNWAEHDDIAGLVREAKSFGITVEVPDVNRSEDYFTVEGKDKIRFSLSAVKNVGASAKEILEERQKNGIFTSMQDLLERTSVKKNAVESLIMSGAFDEFHSNRASMKAIVSPYKDLVKKRSEKEKLLLQLTSDPSDKALKKIANATAAIKKISAELDNIIMPYVAENIDIRLREEKEVLGIYLSGHPLDAFALPSEYNAVTIAGAIDSCNKMIEQGVGTPSRSTVLCAVNAVTIKTDKRGGKFAIVDAEDRTGQLTVLIWADRYERYANVVTEGAVLLIHGKVNRRERFDDEQSFEYTIYADSVRQPLIKESRVVAPTRNANDATATASYLYNTYADKDGIPIALYIADSDTYRPLGFKVSKEIKKEKGIQ